MPVDIKGKEYYTVNERILIFRKDYPDHTLSTELVSNIDGVCVMKASVTDPKDRLVATGYAYEKEGSTFINKTSYIENCETSAWGRALGNLGIGISTSIASSDEVENAIANQGGTQKPTVTSSGGTKASGKATGKQLNEIRKIGSGQHGLVEAEVNKLSNATYGVELKGLNADQALAMAKNFDSLFSDYSASQVGPSDVEM